MVMVLGFLGVAFLLIALNSMGADGESDGGTPTSAATNITPTSTSTSPSKLPQRPPVRVYNISDVTGAAEVVANRLRDAQWNVTETSNLTLEGIEQTTVYFGPAAGEREAAEDVGKVLDVPVAPRVAELEQQPPGVVVLVTG